jgi:hypothetical protein
MPIPTRETAPLTYIYRRQDNILALPSAGLSVGSTTEAHSHWSTRAARGVAASVTGVIVRADD